MKRPLTLALMCCGFAAQAAAADPLAEVQEAYKAGRTGEAMRKLDALITLHPNDARLRFQKGVMLVDQKRPNDAVQVFQKLVQDYPSLPEPMNNLAVLYVERGDMEKARTTLEAAIRSKPNYGTAFQNLGDLYTRMASRAYARALQIDDADGAPKLALIRNLYEPPEPAGLGDTLIAQAPAAPPAPASRRLPTAASTPSTTPATTAASTSAPVPASPQPASSAGSKPAPVLVAAASAPARAGSKPTSTAAASAPVRVAVAASTPPPRPPKPVPTPAAAEDAEVVAALRAWASAWSRRDLTGYFAAYAPGFKGSDASADAWQAARRVRILGKSSIKVDVSAIKVDVDKGVAKASFRQSYTAGALEVNSRKTLEFGKVGNKWLIRRESVGA